MIPIENSVAGRVADIHHLMPDSGLNIVAEHFLPIRHQLMARKGATLKTIKTVQSHIHALGQCRNMIRKLGLKTVVGADTAGSARQIAESGDNTHAAIASRLAAEIYGLEILAEDVEDEAHNTTRFIVLSARGGLGAARKRPDRHHVHIPRAQRARCALQGARGICHERREHDEARVVSVGRQLPRDLVLCRRRGSSRRSPRQARARGTRLLLQGIRRFSACTRRIRSAAKHRKQATSEV